MYVWVARMQIPKNLNTYHVRQKYSLTNDSNISASLPWTLFSFIALLFPFSV